MKNYLLILCLALALSAFAQRKPTQTEVIYFAFNKAYITNQAATILQAALKQNENRLIDSIKIYAYCDAVGSLGYNDSLAQHRIEAVKAFLIANNTGLGKLKELTGYGKRVPINNNSNDSLRALNRRAEVLIYSSPIAGGGNVRRLIENAAVGESVAVPDINFEGGMHIMLPSSKPVLDSVLSVLRQNPNLEIEILGYVCCTKIGEDGYDLQTKRNMLSVNRAKAVNDFLVYKGIDPKRLRWRGLGNQPKVPEMNDAARSINRRVEFKILKK